MQKKGFCSCNINTNTIDALRKTILGERSFKKANINVRTDTMKRPKHVFPRSADHRRKTEKINITEYNTSIGGTRKITRC